MQREYRIRSLIIPWSYLYYYSQLISLNASMMRILFAAAIVDIIDVSVFEPKLDYLSAVLVSHLTAERNLSVSFSLLNVCTNISHDSRWLIIVQSLIQDQLHFQIPLGLLLKSLPSKYLKSIDLLLLKQKYNYLHIQIEFIVIRSGISSLYRMKYQYPILSYTKKFALNFGGVVFSIWYRTIGGFADITHLISEVISLKLSS